MALMARAPLIVTRPKVPAADPTSDALFMAKAALRRAIGARTSADFQVNQLQQLVDRLEAERRAAL